MLQTRNMKVLGIVLVVLILGVGVWIYNNKDTNSISTQETENSVLNNNYNPAIGEGINETPEEVQTTGSSAPKKLTYTEALKIYGSTGNNFRYQFSANC